MMGCVLSLTRPGNLMVVFLPFESEQVNLIFSEENLQGKDHFLLEKRMNASPARSSQNGLSLLAKGRRGGLGTACHLGMAPVLEQGKCKADVYVSRAEDPHGVGDSVAESDEECPGSSPQTARCAWVMPERHGLVFAVPISVSSSWRS